jgi:asparagine synthetase B (glutamine-hydrolysing)
VKGILGWFDPDGVDRLRLIEAARSTLRRGSPTVHEVDPTLSVALLGDAATAWSGVSRIFIDGRIDAVMRCPQAIDRDLPPIGALHQRIERAGLEALNEFAAEFALAWVREPGGTVMLARDTFGLRPLFVASTARGFAFASEPDMLFALDSVSNELDSEAISAFLAGRYAIDGRTAFHHLREVPPGSWLELTRDGHRRQGRWVNPERLSLGSLSHNDAVDALREALQASVKARARGRRAAIALSGGMDSASVMMAASRANVRVAGITRTYDQDLLVNESGLAKSVCRVAGMDWLSAPVESCPTTEQMRDMPRWSGSPISFPAFPEALAVPEAAHAQGIQVVMTGEGEALFAGSGLVILDLIRRGRISAAVRASRLMHEHWGHSFARQAKVAGRALAPRRVLLWRERNRVTPPWVRRISELESFIEPPARSDRAVLLSEVVTPSSAGFSLEERLYQSYGIEFACPLLDLRVLSVALSVPIDDRAPISTPKPLLADAFLGDLAISRVKMSFVPYYRRLAKRMQASSPWLFSSDGHAAQAGLIEPPGLTSVGDDTWLQDSLALGVLETWLRREL